MSPILDQLQARLPGACRYFQEYGEQSLVELSRAFHLPGPPPSPTLRAAVARRTYDLYGPDLAARVEAGLARGQPALTAHHHGLDTHPEMVQGGLLFALADILPGAENWGPLSSGPAEPPGPHPRSGEVRPSPSPEPPPTLILACGTVSLRSPTGPGGLMLGRRGADGRLIRAHLFPRSLDACQVGLAPPLTSDQMDDFRDRLKTMPLLTWEREAVSGLLDHFLLHPDFLTRPDFIAQAAWFNSAVWAARLPGGPPLVFLELESVVGDCLKADLQRPDSPVHRLLTDKKIRGRLLSALAGRVGCWSPRLLDQGLDPALLADSAQPWGTVLFWETDRRGRRQSLALGREGGRTVLRGGSSVWPLTPESLATGLTERRLQPGLFLVYLILAWHRLRTFGGIFMVDYLPAMLRIAEELLETSLGAGQLGDEAGRLAAGPQALRLAVTENGVRRPQSMGAVVLSAVGPLTADRLEFLGRTRLRDLWPFTAGEWYQEEIPPARRAPGWPEEVARLRQSGGGLEFEL